jgi:hypothetical protein
MFCEVMVEDRACNKPLRIVSDPVSKEKIRRFPRLNETVEEFKEWKASLNLPKPKPVNTTLPGNFPAPRARVYSGRLPGLGKRGRSRFG